METISIVLSAIVSPIVSTLAEPIVRDMYSRLLKRLDRAKNKYAPKIAPDVKVEKKEIKYGTVNLIFLGFVYIFAISYLSLKIYLIMNSPNQDMLKNSFNISLNMAAIVLLILNYMVYFISTKVLGFISRQHEINCHAQSRIFRLEEQINKGQLNAHF